MQLRTGIKRHLEIKYQIYRTCKSENWETYINASRGTSISDVYAIKDGRKIVFEIQISTISPNVLEERDKKYRNEENRSYWLLDNFLERSKIFESWYHSHSNDEDNRLGGTIPYIDKTIFETGPENHIFIAKGIRSVGLNAKDQTLFTTNNKEIPLAVWVREVLKGNYRRYLEDTAVAYHEKRRLKTWLLPFSSSSGNFIRKSSGMKRTGKRLIPVTGSLTLTKRCEKRKHCKKSLMSLFRDRLAGKGISFGIAESYGLFVWKKIPEKDVTRPFFRLESESKIGNCRNAWRCSGNGKRLFIVHSGIWSGNFPVR